MACSLAGQASPRPACEVLLLDGRMLGADRIRGTAKGTWQLTRGAVGAAGETTEIDAAAVVSVHGSSVSDSVLPAACLRGGNVVRGMLVGGDGAGDHLELQSPVLSALRLPVDRLDCLLLRPDLARARDLVLPEGVDEALFQKATLGFDRLVGTLHQFGEPGIRFQPRDQKEPRWYAARDLVGLRLGGAIAAAAPPAAELCTRAGDRLGVYDYAFTDRDLRVVLEGKVERTLPLGDVACLTLLDRGVVFLSSLVPSAAVEAAHDGDVLLPWQADLAVTGTPLLAGGRCHGRGLGVHSRSRLEFVVPEGVAAFAARVAFDDSALRLRVRGAVDVAVRVDAATVFTHKEMRAGEAPAAFGPVPVRPGQTVALEVDFGPGRDLGDRIDWLSPVFLKVAPGRRN